MTWRMFEKKLWICSLQPSSQNNSLMESLVSDKDIIERNQI